MALVKWLVGFVKIQQRTRVVLNKLSFSNDDDNDDDDEKGADDVVVVVGVMVVNVVSFCRLNQMSVKRMPIIKPIIKHKIFLYKGGHNEHVIHEDVVDEPPNITLDDDGEEVDDLLSLNVLYLNIFFY